MLLTKPRNQEKGAVLLFAILLLGAVLLIGLSFGVLAVREAREANDSRLSEPSIYISESASESTLYKLYVQGQNLQSLDVSGSPVAGGFFTTDTSGSLGSPLPFSGTVSGSPVTADLSLQLYNPTVNLKDVGDAANCNQNAVKAGVTSPAVVFTGTTPPPQSGNNGNYSIIVSQWTNLAPVQNPATGAWECTFSLSQIGQFNGLVTLGGTGVIIPQISAGNAYTIQLVWTPTDPAAQSIEGQLVFNAPGVSLPGQNILIGELGKLRDILRKFEVTIPRPPQ